MCVCVYIDVYVYAYVRIYVRMYVRIFVCMYVEVYACVYIPIHVHVLPVPGCYPVPTMVSPFLFLNHHNWV